MAYKRLTDEQRYQIEALKREGFTQAAIAQSIGTSPSTISRELRRNSDGKGYTGGLRPRKTLGYATPTEVFFGKSFGEKIALQG